MSAADTIFQLTQQLANERSALFRTKGPGTGDRDTASFMAELRRRATSALEHDYSEQTISGENNLRVDFFIPQERTIIEVAFGLKNPLSEYAKDILKALLAQEEGHRIERLVFIAKPGGLKRFNQPGAQAFADWVEREHGLRLEVLELVDHQGGPAT